MSGLDNLFQNDDFRRAVKLTLFDWATNNQSTTGDLDTNDVKHEDTAVLTTFFTGTEDYEEALQDLTSFRSHSCAVLQVGILVGLHLQRLRAEGMG